MHGRRVLVVLQGVLRLAMIHVVAWIEKNDLEIESRRGSIDDLCSRKNKVRIQRDLPIPENYLNLSVKLIYVIVRTMPLRSNESSSRDTLNTVATSVSYDIFKRLLAGWWFRKSRVEGKGFVKGVWARTFSRNFAIRNLVQFHSTFVPVPCVLLRSLQLFQRSV